MLDFARALLNAPGAMFFSGLGESGIGAHKLAQTLGFARSAFLPPSRRLSRGPPLPPIQIRRLPGSPRLLSLTNPPADGGGGG